MTADITRWMMGDPEHVYSRIEEAEQRRYERSPEGRAARAKAGIDELFEEVKLTEDESMQIEGLLSNWYDHEARYRPALGAPRVSVSCREYDPGEVHDDGDDKDAKINQIEAEAVAACIDELHYLQKAAISLHMRNKTGPAVWRNCHIGTREEAHIKYQEAKAELYPRFKRKGLLK